MTPALAPARPTTAEPLVQARALAEQLATLTAEAQRDFPRCRANLWLAAAADAAARAVSRLEARP